MAPNPDSFDILNVGFEYSDWGNLVILRRKDMLTDFVDYALSIVNTFKGPRITEVCLKAMQKPVFSDRDYEVNPILQSMFTFDEPISETRNSPEAILGIGMVIAKKMLEGNPVFRDQSEEQEYALFKVAVEVAGVVKAKLEQPDAMKPVTDNIERMANYWPADLLPELIEGIMAELKQYQELRVQEGQQLGMSHLAGHVYWFCANQLLESLRSRIKARSANGESRQQAFDIAKSRTELEVQDCSRRPPFEVKLYWAALILLECSEKVDTKFMERRGVFF